MQRGCTLRLSQGRQQFLCLPIQPNLSPRHAARSTGASAFRAPSGSPVTVLERVVGLVVLFAVFADLGMTVLHAALNEKAPHDAAAHRLAVLLNEGRDVVHELDRFAGCVLKHLFSRLVGVLQDGVEVRIVVDPLFIFTLNLPERTQVSAEVL